MIVKKLTKSNSAFPPSLLTIASVPKALYYLGATPSSWSSEIKIAIVGTRAVSSYGKQVTAMFARGLAEQGIHIVSGLALGVDTIAHAAAVESGGTHIAILANGLDKIYPASNTDLARKLLLAGGTILSEYPEGTPSFKQHFVARNRIVSGLADALLITEASEKSGTLHTARFALEQGKDVFVVPGNITSPQSAGTNNLIKSGATPVTSVADILEAMHMHATSTSSYRYRGDSDEEERILQLLYDGISDAHELLVASKLEPDLFTQTLTMLELSGKIYPLGNNHWAPKQ